MELWGGFECTVNRVGDHYFDQIVRTGHEHRLSDLSLIAELGVRAVRYPVLWERVAARGGFDWEDARLAEIKRLGMRPIAGLIHHGSGPPHVDLLHEDFALGLAAHAAAAAQRYDWVQDWTPVNEPLTTARFSALYGWWAPHVRDEGDFWRALLNQIDAVRFSMREIRRVRSDARLVQTEDLGHTHATPSLAGQARFENLRRWLTWDLLCGRVSREHPLWSRLARHGLGDRLKAIEDAPCPADVIGVNHYLTSERYIDERLDHYPAQTHGGNEARAYADVEAVRAVGLRGLRSLLHDAWLRYGADIAVTECHLGCTREEQMRWFAEVWCSARELEAEGVPVRAVTAWSLLGAYDWCHLLRHDAGSYESGVFGLRGGGPPRPTGLARTIKALAQGDDVADEPALMNAGWWAREVRKLYPPGLNTAEAFAGPSLVGHGSEGMARRLAKACRLRALPFSDKHAGAADVWATIALSHDREERACRVIFEDHSEKRRRLEVVFAEPLCVSLDQSFAVHTAQRLLQGLPVSFQQRAMYPATLDAMVHASLDLWIDGEEGLWRIRPEACAEEDFVRRLAEALRRTPALIALPPEANAAPARSEPARVLPLPGSLDQAIEAFIAEAGPLLSQRRRLRLVQP